MQTLNLHVERLIWRGRGLARLDSGQVVIISPGVFPGEEITARVRQRKRDYLLADWVDIRVPHPRRRVHPCSLAAQCGGCRFGWLPHREQVALKAELVSRELRRALPAAAREGLPRLQVAPSPKAWRYRWRGQVHVRQRQPFMMSHMGQEPLPCSDCLLLARPLGRQLSALSASLPDGRFIVAASHLTQEAGAEGQELELGFALPAFDLELYFPVDIFFQANWSANRELVSFVCDQIPAGCKVADLYAGAGNFALPLGRLGHEVLALEADPKAVQAGKDNAARQGLNQVRFKRYDLARPEALGQQMQKEKVQAAIVDPPRTGGGRKLAAALDVPSLQRLVWVSCDVVNTCRDLAPFLAQGWQIRSMHLYDLFPQTWHAETVFVLER